jgi:hypothetical protein
MNKFNEIISKLHDYNTLMSDMDRDDIVVYLEKCRNLIDASKPFISTDVVVETCGTIPLIDRLEKAIAELAA